MNSAQPPRQDLYHPMFKAPPAANPPDRGRPRPLPKPQPPKALPAQRPKAGIARIIALAAKTMIRAGGYAKGTGGTVRRVGPRVGRNQPCACGCGARKRKWCGDGTKIQAPAAGREAAPGAAVPV